MTLVINEIHILEGFKHTRLVAAADRRITKKDRTFQTNQRKLFEIPYLRGAVSFFGMADFTDGRRHYDIWKLLQQFITRHSHLTTLRDFSFELREELSRLIHICGYGRASLPDYWWLTNIREMRGAEITKVEDTFKAPGSHFLDRDARSTWGWDGSDPMSVQSRVFQTYRNGDFIVHARAIDFINGMLDQLWDLPAFKRPDSDAEYKKFMHYKFKTVTDLHKTWLRHPTVGGKTDIMMWVAKDGFVRKI